MREEGAFVLYWMIAARRRRWNFGLQRAVEHATALSKPLLVLEAVRCDYPWASDRLHRFILDGMEANRRAFAGGPARYLSYVEPRRGAGKGLLERLAREACLIVTDDFPAFFLPRMLDALEGRIDVRLERVDSNGLLPMRATRRVFTTAFSFRRFLHDALPEHLERFPAPDPLAKLDLPPVPDLDEELARRWPALDEDPEKLDLSALPLDHGVPPARLTGGPEAGAERVGAFVEGRLDEYGEGRNHPDDDASSGLSPYLHFGHVSTHQVFAAIAEREDWSVDELGKPTGKRSGWWGMSEPAEAFLDQLVTWREVGFNRCALRDDFDEYDSLPEWARTTLEEHEGDTRPHLYDLETLDAGETDDRVWNAAQNELREEGTLHNYLRMLWGKRILEWSPSPRVALDRMIELNNRYALDGRDPNSYSGIFWVLGRYDRAWGPERPIFGKIRYMSSKNTLRKLRMSEYLERYAPDGSD